MLKKYSIELGVGSLKKIIKNVSTYASKVENKTEEVLDELANVAFKKVQSTIYIPQATDSDKTQIDKKSQFNRVFNSTYIEKNENIRRIVQSDPQAIFFEFGTGIVGSKSPALNKTFDWNYDINNHGEKGWIYGKGGNYFWTSGQQAYNQMYYGAREVEKYIKITVKKVFDNK